MDTVVDTVEAAVTAAAVEVAVAALEAGVQDRVSATALRHLRSIALRAVRRPIVPPSAFPPGDLPSTDRPGRHNVPRRDLRFRRAEAIVLQSLQAIVRQSTPETIPRRLCRVEETARASAPITVPVRFRDRLRGGATNPILPITLVWGTGRVVRLSWRISRAALRALTTFKPSSRIAIWSTAISFRTSGTGIGTTGATTGITGIGITETGIMVSGRCIIPASGAAMVIAAMAFPATADMVDMGVPGGTGIPFCRCSASTVGV